MIKLKELAITSMDYKAAFVREDGSITHYSMPAHKALILKKDIRAEFLATLKENFGIDAEIDPILPSENRQIFSENVTPHLTKTAQYLVGACSYRPAVLEYNEERAVKPTFLARLERKIKKLAINLAWKYHHKYPLAMTRHYFAVERLGGVGNFFARVTDQWTQEIFTRRVTPYVMLGLQVKEHELEQGYALMSEKIEHFGETVKGSIAGLQKVELADTVGDGHRRYVLWCGLHVSHVVSNLIGTMLKSKDCSSLVLKSNLITSEGEVPPSISSDPKIEVVNIDTKNQQSI